jgi:hypothetical protein
MNFCPDKMLEFIRHIHVFKQHFSHIIYSLQDHYETILDVIRNKCDDAAATSSCAEHISTERVTRGLIKCVSKTTDFSTDQAVKLVGAEVSSLADPEALFRKRKSNPVQQEQSKRLHLETAEASTASVLSGVLQFVKPIVNVNANDSFLRDVRTDVNKALKLEEDTRRAHLAYDRAFSDLCTLEEKFVGILSRSSVQEAELEAARNRAEEAQDLLASLQRDLQVCAFRQA